MVKKPVSPPTDKPNQAHERRVEKILEGAPVPFDDALRRLVNTPPKPKSTKPPEKGKKPAKGKAAS